MYEFIAFIVVLVGFGFMSFITGVDQGKIEQCKTLQTEYYKGQCVVVQRKEIKL